jgi:hypothetical protein
MWLAPASRSNQDTGARDGFVRRSKAGLNQQGFYPERADLVELQAAVPFRVQIRVTQATTLHSARQAL